MILENKDFIELEDNNNIFLIYSNGGLGNGVGSVYYGILFYFTNELNITHKLVILRAKSCGGWFELNDIFEENTNIFYINFHPKKKYYTNSKFYNSILNMTIPNLNKNKYIEFNFNCLPINFIPQDKYKLEIPIWRKYIKILDLQIKENIIKTVKKLKKGMKLDNNSLGIHVRASDTSVRKFEKEILKNFLKKELDNTIKLGKFNKLFVCSDEVFYEKLIKKKYKTGFSLKKSYPLTKIPGLEEYPWFIDDKDEIERLAKLNIKYLTICKHNEKEYIFNVFRDKNHSIEALIEGMVLNCCGTVVSNRSSSFSAFAKFLVDVYNI